MRVVALAKSVLIVTLVHRTMQLENEIKALKKELIEAKTAHIVPSQNRY